MYGKLFESMYDGTLASDWKALVTFQQMIVLADQDGVVDVTPEALHRRTGIPVDIIKDGIDALERPDERSRTPDCNGCRIIRIDDHRDWGWQIVNHEKYRNLVNAEEKRRKTRERVQKHREMMRNADVTPCNADVTPCNAGVTPCNEMYAHTDTDTDTDTEEEVTTTPAPKSARAVKTSPVDVLFDAFWRVTHRKVGKIPAKKAFSAAVDRVRQEHDCTTELAAGLLTEAMTAFAASSQAADDIKGNIHPSTWLNEGRYDDDRATWSKSGELNYEEKRQRSLQQMRERLEK